MKTALERKIGAVAQARGVSFREAASLVAKGGARKRRVERERLTRVRRTWAWHRDFET